MPEQKKVVLTKWGIMKKKYIKEYKKGLYRELVKDHELDEYLESVQNRAIEMEMTLMKQMGENEGLTPELMVTDNLEFVRRQNNLRQRVGEIVMNEVIFAI